MLCPKCNQEIPERTKTSAVSIASILISLIAIGLFLYFVFTSAIPGYFAAQVRSKVSRAKGEMQMIASGLEAYYKDNKTYPLPDYDAKGTPFVPHVLTTPIAYITALPYDPFLPKEKQGYRYFAGRIDEPMKTYWFLASNGGDKKIDYDVTTYSPIDPFWRDLNGAPITYDPTNGDNSSGDIWRRGP